MKARTKREPKIDWMIHAIANKKERNNPECEIDYITSGFDKHGFGGEVIVVGKVKNAKKSLTLSTHFAVCLLRVKSLKQGIPIVSTMQKVKQSIDLTLLDMQH